MIHLICRRIARISLVAFLVTALILPPPPAVACGPDFTLPTYTGFSAPEDRDFSYERGQLGLLQRGYWHIYLYEAYRSLSGKPFSDAELKALKDWPQGSSEQVPVQSSSGKKAGDWIAAWREIRAKTLGKPAGIEPFYDVTGITRMESHNQHFLFYYNCFQDAFQNAVRTANERQKQLGTENPLFKEWITAQDQVFENCTASVGYPAKPKPAVIPAAARAEDPQVIREDRAYQIAAAHFYAGEFDSARAAFEQIAKDSSSPYRAIAPYLVARTLIRKATLGAAEDGEDYETLGQAETQLRAILADKDSAAFHRAAERLLGFVRIRLHPAERLQELEGVLLNGKPKQARNQDLTDYLWLLDHPTLISTRVASSQEPGTGAQSALSATPKAPIENSDMTDWILSFRQLGDPAFQHSFQRWHETNSLPWLVAAIMKVNAKDADASAKLSAAASKISPDSPAYLTLAFHRIRLLEQSGKTERARGELDQLLARRSPAMPISARNQFRALRMKLATNLFDFLQFAPRLSTDASGVAPLPAGEADYKPGTPEYAATRPHFDSDASVVLTEKLPLRLLADAAKSSLLPPDLRRSVAAAAWTRAILLKNEAVARELLPVVTELVPEVKPALAEYSSAADAEQREFAAVFAILRNPGFRPFVSANPDRGWFIPYGESGFDKIDNLHDNWWCRFAPPPPNEYWGYDYYRMFVQLREPLKDVYPGGAIPEPGFLRNEEKAAAAEEQAALVALPSGPRWLGKLTIAWATAHPDDSRVPEALHLVVRAWHYGCTESTGENYSTQAFELLHRRYPGSKWTKQTPYWYK
jgi:hypothetical protein